MISPIRLSRIIAMVLPVAITPRQCCLLALAGLFAAVTR